MSQTPLGVWVELGPRGSGSALERPSDKHGGGTSVPEPSPGGRPSTQPVQPVQAQPSPPGCAAGGSPPTPALGRADPRLQPGTSPSAGALTHIHTIIGLLLAE